MKKLRPVKPWPKPNVHNDNIIRKPVDKELSVYRAFMYIFIICIFILGAVIQTARLDDEIQILKSQVEKSQPVVDWYERNKENLKEVE